jgi:hypothetical protein
VGAGSGIGLSNYNVKVHDGGEEKHALTLEEMPRHDHITAGKGLYLSLSDNRYSGNGGDNFGNNGQIDERLRTGDTDGNETLYGDNGAAPHENRPSYYPILFIEKKSNCVNSLNTYQ